ncbi:hydroxymethylglutaryl-CoA synthase [Xenorhabdus lircayensis]|nr:hydroxymethylglutaryl-CoA synthase [Xenorhabdus lircayensis]
MRIGIDDISLYVPGFFLPLATLAKVHNIDPNKYLLGIGQEKMAVPPPDEDIVSMAANAAKPLLTPLVMESISTVILATESGVDQSKSAGLFIHGILNLRANCRVIEFKQACYGATAGLQMACALVNQRPNERILVIASDISCYQPNTDAECTEGAGAIAMIVSQSPRILNIHPYQGRYSFDVMDFWRPNQHKMAFVDGKLSIEMYLESLKQTWQNYRLDGGLPLSSLRHLCFHLPFTKMAQKAFSIFEAIEPKAAKDIGPQSYTTSQIYGRDIGNCYTASLYIALLSLLENSTEDLSEQNIGLFSYGSGCVGEFFSASVVKGYNTHLRKTEHHRLLQSRHELNYEQYLVWFYQDIDPQIGSYELPQLTCGRYRFNGSKNHCRQYENSQQSQKGN